MGLRLLVSHVELSVLTCMHGAVMSLLLRSRSERLAGLNYLEYRCSDDCPVIHLHQAEPGDDAVSV